MTIESRFTFSAGMVVRKTIVSEIKNAAFKAGVNIVVEEDKGLLSSNYRVRLSGEEVVVKSLKKAIYNYFEKIEQEE